MFDKNQSYVEPHDVRLDHWYPLTLNPSKHIFNSADFKNKFVIFKKKMKELLKNNFSKLDYNFYIEMSKKGRFHLHGQIMFYSFEDVTSFFSFLHENDKLFQYKFGDMLAVDTSTQYKSWLDYCQKQCKFWRDQNKDSQLCSIHPV